MAMTEVEKLNTMKMIRQQIAALKPVRGDVRVSEWVRESVSDEIDLLDARHAALNRTLPLAIRYGSESYSD